MAKQRRKEGAVVRLVDLRVSTTTVRKVPLRLSKRSLRLGGDESFQYVIDIDAPIELRVTHEDPNECCRLATEALDKALSITWQRVFKVQVDDPESTWERDSGTRRGALSIRFREYEVGDRAGTPVYREVGTNHVTEGKLGENSRDIEREVVSVIPATPENREKLEAIIAAFVELRRRTSALLCQDAIAKTLLNVGLLALPMPTVQPTPVRKQVKPRPAKKLPRKQP